MPEIINGQPSAASTEEHIVTDEAATLLNTTHRSSDGKNHADVVTNTADVATNVTAIGLNTTHRGLTLGNPHSVTPTELSLVIGANTQAFDASLDSIAALTYASDSFIKVTAEDTYAIRTIAETKTDLSLNNVSNVATDDTAYNATSWDGNSDAPTKNVVRDKVETMDIAIGLNTTHRGSNGGDHSYLDQAVTIAGSPTHAYLTLSNAPTGGSHATNKDYVDGLFQGLDFLEKL